jgi:hypothetical protein
MLVEEDKLNFGIVAAIIYSISYAYNQDEYYIRANQKDNLEFLCSQLIFNQDFSLTQIFAIRDE